jgi:hypothetical protein
MAHKEAHGEGQEHGMTLTEDEAKTKRCQESYPAADGVNPGGFAEVSPSPISPSWGASAARICAPMFCIGSGCMAWRWATPQVVHKYNQPTGEIIVKGYCGKAGRPVA